MGRERWAARGRAIAAWARATRLGRTARRYTLARGGPLSGGIAYATLFSVVAGLALSYTAFVAVLGGNRELQEQLIQSIDTTFPGVIDDGDGSGLVDPDALVLNLSSGGWAAGVVAGTVLLVSALGAMGALRRSIRAMFGFYLHAEHPALGKVRDFAAFLVIAAAILASTVVSIALSTAGEAVFSWLDIASPFARLSISVGGLLASLVVDTGVVVLGVRLLANVRAPRRDLLVGALLAGVLIGLVRYAVASGVQVLGSNPLLASFAAIVGVLVWFNLVARVVLFASAFIANPPEPPLRIPPDARHVKERPNYVTLSAPHTLEWPHNPTTGQITAYGSRDVEPREA